MARVISVVIPAHNEEATIGRLLVALTASAVPGELDIVVVCNGCTDRTAEVAATFEGDVRVIAIPEPSKAKAQRRGDEVALAFPRAYVDADVVISAADLRIMQQVLTRAPTLACAPSRRFDRSGMHAVVRWYYDVWENLPQVKSGLFGRGVVMVTEAGYRRIRELPPVMSDDLVMSEAFTLRERVIVEEAEVIVVPPRSISDLVRRRIRVATGNAQAQEAGLRGGDARTSVRGLLALVRREPPIAFRVPVFVAVTIVARIASRRQQVRGDYTTWLRDDSSRQPPT